MTLTVTRSRYSPYVTSVRESNLSVCSLYNQHFSSYKLETIATSALKMTLKFPGSNYLTCTNCLHQNPIFCIFLSNIIHFQYIYILLYFLFGYNVKCQFFQLKNKILKKKFTDWQNDTQMTFTLQGQNYRLHVLLIPGVPTSHRFAL